MNAEQYADKNGFGLFVKRCEKGQISQGVPDMRAEGA